MRFSRTALRACIGALAAWTMALALGGCGAGVVGTGSGTGDDGDEDIEFTALPVCYAAFAAANLACPAPGNTPELGTATVSWADANKSNEGASALAILELNTMSLQVPCSEVSFLGNWGSRADGTRGFFGRYMGPSVVGSRPAIVLVLPAPNEPDAAGWLEMVDESGSKLFGPWLVRRVEGDVAFGQCPP